VAGEGNNFASISRSYFSKAYDTIKHSIEDLYLLIQRTSFGIEFAFSLHPPPQTQVAISWKVNPIPHENQVFGHAEYRKYKELRERSLSGDNGASGLFSFIQGRPRMTPLEQRSAYPCHHHLISTILRRQLEKLLQLLV
jgi:hypothetical protein